MMPSQQIEGTIDIAIVERLSTGFNRCFETLDAGEDLFAEDALFDIYPPLWRFQLQGPDAFSAHLREIADRPSVSRILRVVPTTTGFVMEHDEEAVHASEPLVARHLWLCEVSDGRITEAVGYCNGSWDAELRARHAAEAPMLRP